MKEIYKNVMVNDQNSRILIGNMERVSIIRAIKINVSGEKIHPILSASVTKWTLETDIN